MAKEKDQKDPKKPVEDEAAKSEAAKADAEKKEAAKQAAADAAKAAEEAKAAAEDASRKAELAAAAQADAEGLVLVTVPNRYGLFVGGVRHTIEPGSQKVSREIAEHPYSIANGVKIVGLPTK